MIQDNKVDAADINVYVSGAKINVNGTLSNTTPIGVTLSSGTGVFTNSSDASLNDASKFVSDSESYLVGQNADGQLLLGVPVTVSYATDHGTAPDAQTVASGSLYILPAAPTASGWSFDGWSDGTNTHDAGAELTVSANTSFTAQWTAVGATAPTISAQPQALGLTYGYESGSLSITAEAAEGHTLSAYQWYANTANSGEGGTAISGATDASYDIPTGKSAGTTEYYYCVVTAARTDNGETASTTSAVAALTVGRAAATVNADFMHKAYGDSDPTLTATVTGLKNGDAASVIRYTLERARGEEIGLYTIFPLDLGSEETPLGSFELTVSPRMTTQVEGGSGESAVAVEGLDELADAL